MHLGVTSIEKVKRKYILGSESGRQFQAEIKVFFVSLQSAHNKLSYTIAYLPSTT